ncbi:acyl-CoA thioesterase [Neolewinella antarctica]|uniref:Acyl-CoA thioester hydrolase n=1 Tax=Neolewinella antarctica TaxID=442734 RepID=A0ABX0X8Z6_9BACT|nr:thioesterase family protein [Neolewinella antarctica]NJC25429.1 acyl-CoA thioester hydrolase [Neolewinella antarctica]
MRLSLEDFQTTVEFPTHWGDMDSARHVNNLVYLKWAETARVIYFEAMNMNTAFAGEGTGTILGWQDCKYIFPMTHPDTVVVGVRTSEILEDRFTLQTAVFSKNHERIVAVSHQVMVPYNYSELRKVAMPQEWIDGIEKIESADWFAKLQAS